MIFSVPTWAPSVPALTIPSSCSWKCTCKGGPLARGGREPSRVRTICPWASCTRRIRKISPVWRFSNLRKLSTIHTSPLACAFQKQLPRILSVGPPTGSKPFAEVIWQIRIRLFTWRSSSQLRLLDRVEEAVDIRQVVVNGGRQADEVPAHPHIHTGLFQPLRVGRRILHGERDKGRLAARRR